VLGSAREYSVHETMQALVFPARRFHANRLMLMAEGGVLKVSELSDEIDDRQTRIFDICECGYLSTELAACRLREAEALAVESFEWASISTAWLNHLGEAGLSSAVTCAGKSATQPNFCCGWLSGAEAWQEISQYDPSYSGYVKVFMSRAEDYIEDSIDACCCANTWMSLALENSQIEALRMMKMAENITLVHDCIEEIDAVCESWVRYFGADIGGEYARRFRRRVG
jgi:hypothetical protein